MKIYNNENQVVFNGKFTPEMLDLENMIDQGDSLLIPITDPKIQLHTNDLAWSFAESHDWIATDDSKVKVYLYIDLIKGDKTIMIESFPYLPCDQDLKIELNSFDDKNERNGIKAYYEEIKDYLNEHTCGEFDCVKVEFSENELICLNSILDR
jgi:hypothetical protein